MKSALPNTKLTSVPGILRKYKVFARYSNRTFNHRILCILLQKPVRQESVSGNRSGVEQSVPVEDRESIYPYRHTRSSHGLVDNVLHGTDFTQL